MKKFTSLILVGALALSLTACGSTATESNQSTTGSNASSTAATTNQNANSQNTIEPNEVELKFHPATSGSYATIKVDSSVRMDDESAWLGLCPEGKDYITELEADDVDVVWFNADAREEDSNPYVFACDFGDVEDGTYALVVCTSDDENIGYVAIQLTMEKKGESLKFDFSNAKVKERPAK